VARSPTGCGAHSPIYFLTVPGTGIVGVRPRLTGEPVTSPATGAYANPLAYAMPDAGVWGDAGRNSIRGPRQFSLDASVSRTFLLGQQFSLDYGVQIDNVLNRVTFSAINRIVTSPQFGQPVVANPMRRLHMSLRLRF
jgi:trimeric autotransporter adhesin